MLSHEQLQQTIRSLDRERAYLIDAETTETVCRERFFYVSPPMISVMKQISLIGPLKPRAHYGRNRTARNHIARIIHALSPRNKHLFVK